MEFDQLRALAAVLEHGSFTRAAEALGLSQSTISFHVKSLEASVGVRLVDRGREGVRPTTSGQMLRGYAIRLLALRQEAQTEIGRHEAGLVGRVTIAASSIPGEYMLPEAIARLRQSHPGVDVVVAVSDSSHALSSLLGSECELAVVGSRPRDRKLDVARYGSDEIVLVAPANPPFDLAADDDLASVPLVLRAEGSGTRAAVADIVARLVGRDRSGPTIEVGSTQAALRCVLAGLGVAFISRLAVRDALDGGRVVATPLEGIPVTREFFVASRRGATLSNAAAALREILVEQGR